MFKKTLILSAVFIFSISFFEREASCQLRRRPPNTRSRSRLSAGKKGAVRAKKGAAQVKRNQKSKDLNRRAGRVRSSKAVGPAPRKRAASRGPAGASRSSAPAGSRSQGVGASRSSAPGSRSRSVGASRSPAGSRKASRSAPRSRLSGKGRRRGGLMRNKQTVATQLITNQNPGESAAAQDQPPAAQGQSPVAQGSDMGLDLPGVPGGGYSGGYADNTIGVPPLEGYPYGEPAEPRDLKDEWKTYIRKYKNWCEERNGEFLIDEAVKSIENLALTGRLCKLPVVFMCPKGMSNSNAKASLAFLGIGVAGAGSAIAALAVEKSKERKVSSAKSALNSEYEVFLNYYNKAKEEGCF